MKAYLVTTAVLFGLLIVAHVWRVFEEGAHLLRDPVWMGINVIAAALGLWAVVLLAQRRD